MKRYRERLFSIFYKSLAMVCLTIIAEGFAVSQTLTDDSPPPPSNHKLFRKAIAYPPTSFDPIYGNTVVDGALRIELFEPLLTLNNAQQVVMAAAKSMTVSEDGYRYQFRLREDLRWSDGKPVTAEDFKTTIERMVDPNVSHGDLPKSTQIALLLKNAQAIIKGQQPASAIGAKVIGKYSLTLTLSDPLLAFDRVLANTLYPTPTHQVKKYGENWSLIEKHISNGPYRLQSERAEGSVVLEKNPFYVTQQPIFFEQVEFVVLNTKEFDRKIQSREIDAIFNYDMVANRVWLAKKLQYRPYFIGTSPKTLLLFNTRFDALNDPNVRRALQLATFTRRLVTRLQPQFEMIEPLYCLLYGEEGIAERIRPEWYDWSDAKRLQTAKTLLANAGYSEKRPLRLRLSRFQEQTVRLIANAIAEQWAAIGIELTTVGQPTDKHYSDLIAGNYQLGLANWEDKFSDPLATLSLLQSDAQSNLTGWRSAAYDDLFTRIGQLKPGPKRTALIEQTQIIIIQHAPMIPLISNSSDPAYLRGDIQISDNDPYIQSKNARRVP